MKRRKRNRILSFLMTSILVFTMFFSNLMSAYAEDCNDDSATQQATVITEQESESITEQPETEAATENEQPEVDEVEITPEEIQEAPKEDESSSSEAAGTAEEEANNANQDASINGEATEASSASTAETSVEEDNKEELESKIVTVTYEATEGGIVSVATESVNLNDEAATFSGSEAIANEGYKFENWKDSDGNVVSTENVFVPSNIDKDTVYTAVFEKTVIEQYVTVTYKASKGGSVTTSSETIDINAEGAKFKGSRAVAWNDKYEFEDWINEEGKVVGTNEEYVPSNINKDITFTAKFKAVENIEDKMPAIKVSDVHKGGMVVSVNAEVGIFPAGTELSINAISDSQALETAKEELGEKVTSAKGVDITFKYEGKEIQPADNKYVHVSISLEKAIEGDSFSVLHDHKGDVDKISANVNQDSKGNAVSATFDTNQFSIFIVAGEGDSSSQDSTDTKATRTYEFYSEDETTPFNTQIVKKGDTLHNPGIPKFTGENSDKKVFYGWYTKDEDGKFKDEITFGEITEEITSREVIKVYAKIETTYYVTFIGPDKEVVQVKSKIVVNDSSDKKLSTKGVIVTPKNAEDAFEGWSTEPPVEGAAQDNRTTVEEVDVTKVKTVYAVVVTAHWITFDENDGGVGGGADYTSPIFVKHGESLSGKEPVAPNRRGYIFGGWYKQKGNGDGQVSGQKFAWSGELTENITLYAKWTAKTDTQYSVVIWQQKISDSKTTTNNADKSYDYKKTIVVNGTTGSTLGENSVNPYKNEGSEGFSYSWYEIVRNKNGKNVPTTGDSTATGVVRPQGDTVINVYFDRVKVIIRFNKHNGIKWEPIHTFEGLYGQTLKQNNYTWPSDYLYYEGHTDQGNQHYGSGTRLVLLDAFLTHQVSSGSDTLDLYAKNKENVNLSIFFIKQKIDGTYPQIESVADSELATDVVFFSGGTFYVTDKYNGFSLDEASYKKESYSTTWSSWKKVKPNDTIVTQGDIRIRFARNKYALEFKNGTDSISADSSFAAIPYEKNLSEYEALAPKAQDMPKKQGFEFQGWYEDEGGQKKFDWNSEMPAADKVLFAYYKPLEYHVKLDPNGGIYTAGTEFTLRYDESKGKFEEVSKETLTQSVSKEGYELIGWFDKATNLPYEYGQPNRDVELIAMWRKPGTYKLNYIAAPHGSFDNNAQPDQYDYAGDSWVVVAARPDTIDSNFIFIGWKIEKDPSAKVYYPNNSFQIQGDYIENGKVNIVAVYVELGEGPTENTTIIYDCNYTLDSGESAFPQYVISPKLKVNESIAAATLDQTGFSRPGYDFLGWNTDKDAETELVKPGYKFIAADNNGVIYDANKNILSGNTLYAIWKKQTGSYVVKYYKDSVSENNLLGTSSSVTVDALTEITLTVDTAEGQLNWKKEAAGAEYADGVQQGDIPFVVQKGDANVINVLYKTLPVTVYVEGSKETYPYDGDDHFVSGYTVRAEANGVVLSDYTESSYSCTDDFKVTGKNVKKDTSGNLASYTTAIDVSKFTNLSTKYHDVTFVLGTQGCNELEITPIEISYKTEGAEKEYDGKPLTCETASITGLIASDEAIVKIKGVGSQTEVGESDNTESIDWGTVNKDNYAIKEKSIGKLIVKKNTATITLTAASDNKVYDGKPLTNSTVTATGLPEGFTVEATATGSQTNVGKGDNTVDDGYVIKNSEGEDRTSSFTDVQKESGILEVTQRTLTVTTGSDSKLYDGKPLTKDEASISGFADGEDATIKATGSQTEVGHSDNTYTITWSNAKEGNYTISENLGVLTVNESDVEVTLTVGSSEKVYDGKPLTNNIVTLGVLDNTIFEVKATVEGSITDVGTKENILKSYQILLREDGSDKTGNFTNVKVTNGTLTVTQRELTIGTGSAEKEYDGTELTSSETSVNGLAETDSIKVTATGSQTEVGQSDNTCNVAWGDTNKDNYNVTYNLGTLKVTTNGSLKIILTAASDDKEYDGTALTNSTVTATGLPEGFTVEATATGSQTDVGSSSNTVNDGYKILNKDGKDETESFTGITTVTGTLEVTKRTIKVSTGSAEKEYDGLPLTKDEASIENLASTDESIVTITATGSQTNVGKSDNTYSIEWGTVNSGNYSIEESLGTLEVKKIAQTLKLISKGGSKAYDGQALTNPTVTYEGLPEGFTVEATATGSQTNVGTCDNLIDDSFEIKDKAGNTCNEAFESIIKDEGILEVTPKTLTITTDGDSKVYDGTPLTCEGYDVEGLVDGEEVTVTTTGTITDVGEKDNTYDIEWVSAKEDNYTIVSVLGKLIITKSDVDNIGGAHS